jgi:hypothetical protein
MGPHIMHTGKKQVRILMKWIREEPVSETYTL